VVYAVYIYGNQNDLTCPENFAPIISDWECKAAALFMGFSAAPSTNALGPIADYTSSSPISNGLCFWERWAEEDRANITFRANQIQPAVDSGPLCTYGAPLSYTPSLYAAPTRHCRPDAPNSLRSVPPTLYHLSYVATAPTPMPACGLTSTQFQSQLCFVCVAKRVSPLTPTNLPPSATPAPTNVPYKMGSSCSATSCGCPANYFRITDEIACSRAANAMGKNFSGLSTRKPAPSGCFDTGTGSIEFTDRGPTWKDPDGMDVQTYSLLCATGVTIPACTPCCSLLHSLLRQFLP
jgi:hypothetical protein